MRGDVDLHKVLDAVADVAWGEVVRAMRDDATVNDIAVAAAMIRASGDLRRKSGAASAAYTNIEAEFLIGLSLRLMEVDDGDDLTASQNVADLISEGLKKLK